MKNIRCPICGYQHYGQNSRWVEIANKRVDEKARFFNIKDNEIIEEMGYLFYYLIAHELFSVSLFVNPEDYKEWKRKYVPQLYDELDLSSFGFKRLKMLVEKTGYHPRTIITWKREGRKMELKPYAEKLKKLQPYLKEGWEVSEVESYDVVLKKERETRRVSLNEKEINFFGDIAHAQVFEPDKIPEILEKYKDILVEERSEMSRLKPFNPNEWKLKPGATYVFYDGEKWFWCGDTAHIPKEDIEYNANKLYEIWERYKDVLAEIPYGVSKDYDTNYVYLIVKEYPLKEEIQELRKLNLKYLKAPLSFIKNQCRYGIEPLTLVKKKLSIKEAIKLALE